MKFPQTFKVCLEALVRMSFGAKNSSLARGEGEFRIFVG